MAELAAERRRKTHVMVKGNFLTPGAAVEAAVPAKFHPLPRTPCLTDRGSRGGSRSRNPLTARVAVNRFWAQLSARDWSRPKKTSELKVTSPRTPSFSTGSPSNSWNPVLLPPFARGGRGGRMNLRLRPQNQATRPPQPPLAKGGDRAWDMKRFLKLIVTRPRTGSRRTSLPSPRQRSPQSSAHARPRYRLEAEMVRDQALALSGLVEP